ncbi:MAG TPA: corrinoid protein [Thermoanaerobaculia bacterium]|nr:corrinoid protein [Thermoanaerobaculia bacterium]
MSGLDDLRASIERGDAPASAAETKTLIDGGARAGSILDGALLPGMAAVGVRFRDREIFLPDVLLAARAMKASMALLEPLLLRDSVPASGVVVLGTVRGDLHDIGKNLVSVMLQGAGWRVVDLGTDVDPDAFIDAALEAEASLIGISALLTTTMTEMAAVIERLDQRGLRARLRTMIGGAPVSADFAREIGADGFARDAVGAVECAAELVR